MDLTIFNHEIRLCLMLVITGVGGADQNHLRARKSDLDGAQYVHN